MNFREAQAQFEADREREASEQYDCSEAESFEESNLEERAERYRRYSNWW